MTTASNVPLESLDDDLYIRYLEQADGLISKGYYNTMSGTELAKQIYIARQEEKEKKNES